ncbi:MAG: hypothetical protein OEZ01_16215, partial [Candidatus Heimdallarchaeota archaeon]|nr:hypothetical protein [Candidatus Heimdallarchaeota archaeon]
MGEELMPGLTLLNIDRERTSTANPLDEITEIIQEINDFINNYGSDIQNARLMPLRSKLRRLQDAVSQFGTDGSVSVVEKQSAIMDIHPELLMLSNSLALFGSEFATLSEICMNFLLNHLCSTAAADPKSTVIGVSNVMAQVLSTDIQITTNPSLQKDPSDQKYFEEFALIFNSMLTTAGLFSAPVLGLPDIPISALGGWSDQALRQFSEINQFVEGLYDPLVFYQIDKSYKATPFDTTADILSFYVYENEFLAALIARADLLSGLELPSGFRADDNPSLMRSSDEITNLLATAIERNCGQILATLDKINVLYNEGKIDRNEKPSEHPTLVNYRTEANLWMKIAQLAKLMIKIFQISKLNSSNKIKSVLRLHLDSGAKYPPMDDTAQDTVQQELRQLLIDFEEILFGMFPQALSDTENFIQSSSFIKFRSFLNYIIHIVAAHDILLPSSLAWTPWLLNNLRPFIYGNAVQYNPYGSLEVGILTITLGKMTDTSILIEEGMYYLEEVKP